MFSILTVIFITGLAFGSFASVIIHRLHTQEKGMLMGRSKCPKCAHTLGVVDLIPLVGYLVNQFKCRYCKEPISLMYPFLELFMGCSFFLTAALTGLDSIPLLVFNLLIAFVFVTLSFYDILFKEVPDSVVLPAFIAALLFNATLGGFSLQSLGLGVMVPVLFFATLFFASRGKWLGGGDVRIGAMMGALLGWPGILVALFLAYLTGSVFSVIGLLTKKLTRKSQIPFAPFLILGTYITMFWQQELLSWYFGL